MRFSYALVILPLSLLSACAPRPDENAGGASTGSGGASTSSDGGSGGAGGAPAVCPDGYPLSAIAGKPVVEVMIDGAGPYSFVFDTGAPTSALDTSVYKKIGSGPHVLVIAGKEVQISKLSSAPLQTYLKSTTVSGLLGADIMGGFAVTLDAARDRIWLDEARDEAALRACAHVAGAPVEVAWKEKDYLFVPGTAEGRSGWLMIDTGASMGLVTKSTFDALDAAHPRPALGGFYTPAAAATFWAEITSVGYIEIAGLRVAHIVSRTIDDDLFPTPALDGPLLGVLPSGYFRHFLVTLDYPAGMLRLDGYPALEPREPSGYFTVGIGLEETVSTPVHVATVLPGSSAEEQGVMVGDTVLAAYGTAFSSMSPAQRAWALMAPLDGKKIPVEIEHEGTAYTVQLEARDLLTDPVLP